MDKYALPDVVEKRVRYFDGQFLQDQDFIDEQDYQLDREHRHNRLLHGPGITEGLAVTSAAPNQVTVAPGTAIDSEGRQLVLAQATTVDLPAADFNDKQGIELLLSYLATAEDPQTVGGSQDFTRWLERPAPTALAPGETYSGTEPTVLLATLALDNAGRVTGDGTARSYSGLRLPGAAANAVTLTATSGGSVELAGSLTVDNSVGIGTNPGFPLHLSGGKALRIDAGTSATDSAAYFSFGGNGAFSIDARGTAGGRFTVQNSGNVGIGTNNPQARLEVAGGGGQTVDLLVNGRLRSNSDNGGLWVATDRFIGGDGGKNVGIYTGSAWRLLVTPDGNVGIGTKPGARLEVAGSGGQTVDLLVNGRLRSNSNDGGLWVSTDRFVGGDGGSNIGFFTGGAWRLLATSNGNIGIGTNNPQLPLHLAAGMGLRIDAGTSATDTAAYFSFGGTGTFNIDAPNVGGGRFTVQNSGNVGIGTSNPANRLHVSVASSSTPINAMQIDVASFQTSANAAASHFLLVRDVGAGDSGNHFVIRGDGTTGLGTADTSGYKLCVNGTTWLKSDTYVSGGLNYWWGPDNQWKNIQNRANDYAGSYGTSGPSDIRLKADLQPIGHALDLVRKLQGVRYRWSDTGLAHFTRDIESSVSAGPGATEEQHQAVWQAERRRTLETLAGDRLGLIAQDVEPVVPELVHEGEDGYKQIRYQHLTALLTEAIKEQDAVVRALSSEVADLRARLSVQTA